MTTGVVLLLALLAMPVVLAGCGTPRWRPTAYEKLHSDSFTIFHPSGHAQAAQDVLRVLTDSLPRIERDLRPGRTGSFVVRIYPSVREYHEQTNIVGAPGWSVGRAAGDSELFIVSPLNPGPYHTYQGMLQVAVHELTMHHNETGQSYAWSDLALGGHRHI
jgi:hypothetical protein